MVVRLRTRLDIGFYVWVWCPDLMGAFLWHTGLTEGVCGVLILRRMFGMRSDVNQWGIVLYWMRGGCFG